MDVSPVGNIVSIGERRRDDGQIFTGIQTFSPEGVSLSYSETTGLSKEVVANYSSVYQSGYSISTHVPTDNSKNYRSLMLGIYTNPYTRYSTVIGGPETEPSPWSGYVSVVGPSVSKATPEREYIYARGNKAMGASTWMVGTFCDTFQPYADYLDQNDPNWGKDVFNHSCPTFGKADCFILRRDANPNIFFLPVRHQWGGPENDLAYDVVSDDIGNATIFLRAGSDFGITSATQSLVRMKTGYNIVRLDTNGLLTETFPVSLEATGELTDTQIALGKSGTVYILAKDAVRAQYFLAKVSRSGTVWIHYFPTGVASTWLPDYGREPRMGLTTDSKENAYVTGIFTGAVNLGDTTLTTTSSEAFVAKYSAANKCEWAVQMGVGMGVTVRLSPDETALYVNGWASGKIMGTYIPNQNDPRNGVIRPGAFLVKFKLK
jgi:hypothetical protein